MFLNVIPQFGGLDLFNRYPTLTYLWHFHLDHHRLTPVVIKVKMSKVNQGDPPIFRGRIHNASCFSTSPDVPNLWKVHFVMRGKMQIMGSSRSSCKHCGERLSVSAVKDYPNVCLYLISFCKCNYFQSECKEGTIKESVHKKHLAQKVKVLEILFKSDFTCAVL